MTPIWKSFHFLLAFLILGGLAVSCTTQKSRGPSAVSGRKPIHYVVTLHGVRGNEESYGEFHQFAAKTLGEVDPTYEYRTINWTYPVGDAVEEGMLFFKKIQWNPHTIAQKMNEELFLDKNSEKHIPLEANDKISILAYSMGGMMVMNWYYDTMFNFPGSPQLKMNEKDLQITQNALKQVDNIIGLGPVFWGSVMAELGWNVMGEGDTTQIRKTIPKANAFCENSGIQELIKNAEPVGQFVKNSKEKLNRTEPLKPEEKKQLQVDFTNVALGVMCEGVSFFNKNPNLSKAAFKSLEWMNGGLSLITQKLGNMHETEFENMRPTSEVIHLMRLGRIKHLSDPNLRSNYRTRWTSIVGVFPCLQKKDAGVTCNDFIEPYGFLNSGLVELLTGVKRLEADGPVEGPNAVADFYYYTESKNSPRTDIQMSQFVDTHELSQSAQIKNTEIYVENMHATVAPALMALGGIGSKSAMAMLDFDLKLGRDVVIMNKECASPEACRHPNFKHVINYVTNCDTGRQSCNDQMINRYYGVSDNQSRMRDSNDLKAELGSYILSLNIRVPKDFELSQDLIDRPKNFVLIKTQLDKFEPTRDDNDGRLEMRLDSPKDPYIHQVARRLELMSSYARIQNYSDSKEVRVFLIGRAYPKPGKNNSAVLKDLDKGIPLSFKIQIPGYKPRAVTAKVKPSYTTYVDLFLDKQ